MTRIVSILFLFAYSFSYGQTYTYQPIPKSDVVWKGRNEQALSQGGMCGKYQYKFDGNYSVQGNDTFYKMEVLSSEWSVYTNTTDSVLKNKYAMCGSNTVFDIPEDAENNTGTGFWVVEKNKRVYVLPNAALDTTTDLAYVDFNLSVGDTTAQFPGFQGADTIVSVDTVTINGTLRKRLVRTIYAGFGGSTQRLDTLIEGIGSLKFGLGFDALIAVGLNPITNGEIICFSSNSQQEFIRNNSLCEDLWPLDVDEQLIYTDKLSISPNPFYNKLSIGNIQGATIHVYNLVGRNIYRIEASKAETIEVNTDNWATGLYLISIQKGDYRKINKLVKY